MRTIPAVSALIGKHGPLGPDGQPTSSQPAGSGSTISLPPTAALKESERNYRGDFFYRFDFDTCGIINFLGTKCVASGGREVDAWVNPARVGTRLFSVASLSPFDLLCRPCAIEFLAIEGRQRSA